MPKQEDFTQVARRVVDQATGTSDPKRDPKRVISGSAGGKAKAANERERKAGEAKKARKH